MRVLGIDTSDLLDEIVRLEVNPRTAIYKILRRKNLMHEINNWQNGRAVKLAEIKWAHETASLAPKILPELKRGSFRKRAPSNSKRVPPGKARKRLLPPKISPPLFKHVIFG
jgi:hypothetical protein